MAASPENFTLDSGHYENMPLNAELLEHFTDRKSTRLNSSH